MRPGEAISVVAFLCFIILGWLRRLSRTQQYQVIGFGLFGVATVFSLHALAIPFPETARTIGDWLPCTLILIVYWQSGRFYRAPSHKLQPWLEQFDRQRLGTLLSRWERHWSTTWIGIYFEVAYLFCYVLVPLGVAVLYLAHQRTMIDIYWATVLPATFLCYLVIPFAPTIPPRLVNRRPSPSLSKVQSVNLFILRHASIQLNTFPSAHVASTIAGSLVMLRAIPVVGAAFLLVALSIAAGAILGRYHYTPDVILGALLAIAISRVTLGF